MWKIVEYFSILYAEKVTKSTSSESKRIVFHLKRFLMWKGLM